MKSGFRKNLSKTAAGLLTSCILMGSGMMEIGGFVGDGIGRLTVNAVSEETPASSFFTQIDEDDNLIISSFFGNEKNVVIPSEINGHKVVTIGESAFRGNNSVESVSIPFGVKDIQQGAFADCTALKNVSIPDSVVVIGDFSFENCVSLKKIVLPESVKTIEAYAFLGCTSLIDIGIPKEVSFVGYCAFSDTAWLENQKNGSIYVGLAYYTYKGEMPENTKIQIKDGTKMICDCAFMNCAGLISVTIPDSVTDIEYQSFCQCYDLKEVRMSNNISRIGAGAFQSCWNLKNISFPESIEIIGGNAFYGCSSLKDIKLPDKEVLIESFAFENTEWEYDQPYGDVYCGKIYYEYKGDIPQNTKVTVKTGTLGIAGCAFLRCEGLTEIEFPDGLKYIGDQAFYNCINLKSVMIPDSVNIIDWGTFGGCSNLESVTLSKELIELKEWTFHECTRISEIVIPEKIIRMHSQVFDDCTSLKKVTILNKDTSLANSVWSHGIFYNCSSDLVIYGYKGGIAERDTVSNGIPFVDLDDIKNMVSDYGQYIIPASEGISSKRFYFLPPEDGVYVFKSYSDNNFSICYPANNSGTRIEGEHLEIFKLNKNKLFDFDIINATTDVTVEVLPVDEIAAKDYGVYNISYDGKLYKDFVFMAKADGVYTFTFQSNADFGVYPHEVFTEISPVASGDEKQIHRIAVELKKDESYVFAMMDITSDISVTIGDTISSDFYYPVSIGETTPEYTFSNNHLTLSRIGGLGSFVSAWNSDLYDFRGLIKHVTLNEGVSEINYHTFYNFNNMETVFIPDTVTYIDELAFTYEYWEPSYDENGNVISYGLTEKNIDNLTIYGYSGSYAETYANEMGFAFVAVEKIKDKTSGIEVKGKLDSKTKLKVNDLSVEEIELDDENREVKACYDITLLKGKREVQPEIPVIVMIPYLGAASEIEVFHLNDDGTKDKMIFTFDGSYISFVTDHFSKYIVVGDAGILGDTNGDGVADIADSLMISRYDAGLITLDDAKVAMSDVNNDGSADIADALKIARYDAGLIDSLS